MRICDGYKIPDYPSECFDIKGIGCAECYYSEVLDYCGVYMGIVKQRFD